MKLTDYRWHCVLKHTEEIVNKVNAGSIMNNVVRVTFATKEPTTIDKVKEMSDKLKEVAVQKHAKPMIEIIKNILRERKKSANVLNVLNKRSIMI